MSMPPVTVPANFTVEKTAQVLLRHKISDVPVVGSKGEIVGIITQSDIFRDLIELTGIGKKTSCWPFKLKINRGHKKTLPISYKHRVPGW